MTDHVISVNLNIKVDAKAETPFPDFHVKQQMSIIIENVSFSVGRIEEKEDGKH
jgi:hypothetical protein